MEKPLVIRGRTVASSDIDLIRFLINRYRRHGRKKAGVRSSFLTDNSLKGYKIPYHLSLIYKGSLKDIGTYFGIGESGVFQAFRRVKDKIRNHKKLGRKIAKIQKKSNVSRMNTSAFSPIETVFLR
jgi:hypothetical protein